MSDITAPDTRAERRQATLDWVMFSLGALSLVVAIGGTVLTRSNLIG